MKNSRYGLPHDVIANGLPLIDTSKVHSLTHSPFQISTRFRALKIQLLIDYSVDHHRSILSVFPEKRRDQMQSATLPTLQRTLQQPGTPVLGRRFNRVQTTPTGRLFRRYDKPCNDNGIRVRLLRIDGPFKHTHRYQHTAHFRHRQAAADDAPHFGCPPSRHGLS